MQETGQLRGYLKTADVRAAIGGDGGGVQQSTCTRVAPRNKSNARNMRCRFLFLFLFGNSESLCVVAPVLVSQLMMDGEKSRKRERGQIWVSKFDDLDLDPSAGLISAKSRTGK